MMTSEFAVSAKAVKDAKNAVAGASAPARTLPDGGFAAILDDCAETRTDPGKRDDQVSTTGKSPEAPRSLSAMTTLPTRSSEPFDAEVGGDAIAFAVGAETSESEGPEPKSAPDLAAASEAKRRPAQAGGGDDGEEAEAAEAAEQAEAWLAGEPAPAPPAPALLPPAPGPVPPAPEASPAGASAGDSQAVQNVAAKCSVRDVLPTPGAEMGGVPDQAPDQNGASGTAAVGAPAGPTGPAPPAASSADGKSERSEKGDKERGSETPATAAPTPFKSELSRLFDGQGLAADAPSRHKSEGASPPAGPEPTRLHQMADRPAPWHALPVEIGLRALGGAQSFQIRLHPEELGRIEVKLDFAKDGSVSAVLTVDKPETLSMLQRDARSLERAFEQAGLKSGEAGMQFSLSGDGGRGGERQNHPRQEQQGRAQAAPSPPVGEDARLAESVRLTTRYWSAGPGALNIVI